MDVIILGAGRPAFGDKPSALKNIAMNTKVIDWQLYTFRSLPEVNNIHFLGGYNIEEIIKNYPKLNFTLITNWESKNVLHTLLKAPFQDKSIIISYSDTVFRDSAISKMLSFDADIVYCYDSCWKDRYESRLESDISSAETIKILNPVGETIEVEFTGLIYFNKKVVKHLSNLNGDTVGSNLISLINHLRLSGFTVNELDIAGHWAELNSPMDIAKFILGTKAETLSRLEPIVKKSHIGKQISFNIIDWKNNSDQILNNINKTFSKSNLIVRSSSKNEDSWDFSNAGSYKSILNIDGSDMLAISNAIDLVISSYKNNNNYNDQVLIQKCIQNVKLSGVIFTCSLETGSPYYHFNFDDKTKSTETVSSGKNNDLRNIILSKFGTHHLYEIDPTMVPVLEAVQELEQLLGFDKLDIEFAVDENDRVHIFQVRPITVNHSQLDISSDIIKNTLNDNVSNFKQHQIHKPNVSNNKVIFANMPDWNPAEIIGVRPKPLAFSLYRHLITNDIWSQQRFEYGYKNIYPYPLIFSFSGQPYVDTRSSFNSFIPNELDKDVAERLVKAYSNILKDNPHLHDKIEFEIVFSVWTYNFFNNAYNRLAEYGVKEDDIYKLEKELKKITSNSLTRLEKDIASIQKLIDRRSHIISSDISNIDKFFLLINDCKKFGTKAFAHAARAGFVAITLLKNFVAEGIISDNCHSNFMQSIKTITSEFEEDKYKYSLGHLSIDTLIEKYGHLRPGTYDICMEAYWENPKKYFLSNNFDASKPSIEFKLTKNESDNIQKFLIELGSNLKPDEIFNFFHKAIQSREMVKFEFTHNLSKALDICSKISNQLSITREDMSFVEYQDLEKLNLNITNPTLLKDTIKKNKEIFEISKLVQLPGMLVNESDFYCFEKISSKPNFITSNKINSNIVILNNKNFESLENAIVLIPQADPGFDWLFGYDIGGIITQYGGANSHMAIRAAEMGVPSAIGVGDLLYDQISKMKQLELDCMNEIIRKIQ